MNRNRRLRVKGDVFVEEKGTEAKDSAMRHPIPSHSILGHGRGPDQACVPTRFIVFAHKKGTGVFLKG